MLNHEDLVNVTAAYQQWGLVDPQGALAVRPLQDAFAAAVRSGDAARAAQVLCAREKLHDARSIAR